MGDDVMADQWETAYSAGFVDGGSVSLTTTEPSDNGSTTVPPVGRDEKLAKVEIAVQAVILCLAVMGNLCVLLALRYRRKKTSRLQLFIMHLSIADLLVSMEATWHIRLDLKMAIVPKDPIFGVRYHCL